MDSWLGIGEGRTEGRVSKRRLWLGVALCLSGSAWLGCSSDSAAPETNSGKSPVDEADDDADDEGDDEAKAEKDGSTAAPKVDASKSSPRDAGKSDANAPLIDASVAPSSDASTADAGSAPVVGGKIVLPSPNEMGPYKVIEEDNVGKGFENAINANDQTGPSAFCLSFVSLFGQDQMTNEEYAQVPAAYNMALYTLYRPETMQEGQKFPVLSWANGTCAHTVGYAEMLKHVASHGFIVVATHSRFTGSGAAQLRGLDFVIAANDDPMSPLYKQVDTEKVGLFGHSQGGGSTGVASKDPRVDTSILMNGGDGASLHAPAFFMTGEMDSPGGPRGRYNAARVPAAFGSLKMANHITMMTEYKREAPEVVAWFRYQLLGDEEAKGWFVGSDCVLCKDAEWEYLSKDLQ